MDCGEIGVAGHLSSNRDTRQLRGIHAASLLSDYLGTIDSGGEGIDLRLRTSRAYMDVIGEHPTLE